MTEEDRKILKEIVEEELFKIFYLNEGVDIDVENHIVSFNSSHQNNVDTNDLIHPFIIKNNIRGETVLSIFERKDNEEGNDGNPLVYALKGINRWRFAYPKYDILALLKRFVSVTTHLQNQFDTLVVTPSNNPLNNRVFDYLQRIVHFEYKISNLFSKLSASEVREFYFDEEYYYSLANGDENKISFMMRAMERAFQKMIKDNNNVFSYKYISPLAYRDGIIQSLSVSLSDTSIVKYRDYLNEKNVLVFDDTVASGKTLSDSAMALKEMFDPNSITFLTLFSPKANKDNNINNERIVLQ